MKNNRILKLVLVAFVLVVAISLIPDCSYRKENNSYKAFKKAIRSLPHNDLASITEAQDITLKYLQGTKSQPFRDKAFADYRITFYKVLRNAPIIYKGAIVDECSEIHLRKVREYKKYFKSIGLNMMAMEGCYYLEEDNSFTLNMFSSYLSPSWNEYLKFRVKEQNVFFNDGVVAIPWEEVRERIAFWENFINKYPDFREKNEIKAKLQSYFSGYINAGNAFDYYTEELSPELKTSYENFLKNNTTSKFYPLVKTWYDLLKKNGFKLLKEQHKESEKLLLKCPYRTFHHNEDIFDGLSP